MVRPRISTTSSNVFERRVCARPLTTIFTWWPRSARCSQTTLLRVACPIPSPTTPYKMRINPSTLFESPSEAYGPGELYEALHYVGHALEQVDARRPLLDHVHGNLFD